VRYEAFRGGFWRWLIPAVVGILCSVSPALACWDDHPGAERAFRDGYESFSNEQWEDAIERFRKAKAERRDPDGSCTVQLYGRSRDGKAYYLPYFYLGVASFRHQTASGDQAAACEDAELFFGMSMRWREQTFDSYRSRFRQQWSQFEEIRDTCGLDLGGDTGDVLALRLGATSSVVGSGG
jgi:hypothetical protein